MQIIFEQPQEVPPDQMPQDQGPEQQSEMPPGEMQQEPGGGEMPPGEMPPPGGPQTPVAAQGGEIEDDPPEMTPLKKYYLIEKLYILKNKLNQFSLNNDDLDRVLKFANSFSYETLVSLSEKLAKNINTTLKEEKLKKDKK